MSVNLNKEKFSDSIKSLNEQNKIINFPFKNKVDNKANLKETSLVIKENNILKKFYSVDENKSKLNDDNKKIVNFNLPNNNDNKIPPKPIAITVLGVMLVALVLWTIFHKNANQVYVGDKMVGVIKMDKSFNDPNMLKDLALEELKEENHAKVEVNEDVTFKPVRASKKEMLSIDDATLNVAKNFTFKIEASIITVDGKPITTVKNKDEANKILKNIKDKYVNKNVKQLAEPTFKEDVKIENKYVNEKEIVSNEDALVSLNQNKSQGKEHEIKQGDTLFEIAIKNDLSLEDILKANPNLTENTPLKIGSKVNVVASVPLLSVVTYEEATYTDVIPKKIETVKNNKEYKTYKKVLTAGKDGSKQITAKITKVNGVEEKRDVLTEKVLVQPTVEKVEVGTLNTPPKKSIGTFIYPVRARMSSGFGRRWGVMHKGIDLATSSGTPIKASDGGTVVYSGYNKGGYGNMVKIDHGNGYQTIYAHNSKNAVSVGQKVAQGEVIAYVGSTGNSTGNHVHFEILKNGVAQNPLNYLK